MAKQKFKKQKVVKKNSEYSDLNRDIDEFVDYYDLNTLFDDTQEEDNN